MLDSYRGGSAQILTSTRCRHSKKDPADGGSRVFAFNYELNSRVPRSTDYVLVRRLQCHPPLLRFEEGDDEWINLSELAHLLLFRSAYTPCTNGFGPTPPQGGGTMEKTQGNNALSFFFKRAISFSEMYPIILRNRFASIRRTCDNTAVLFSIGTPVSA